jgi:hypothetical protein
VVADAIKELPHELADEVLAAGAQLAVPERRGEDV